MAGNLAQAAFGPADPHPQSRKLARAQVLLDRLEPVMATAASLGPQSNLPKRQIRVIHHHQDPFWRNLVIRRQRDNRFTTGIHVGLRLAKNYFATTGLSYP